MKESLTIREASWLTDRTYDYDDVVRMVGELVAVHKGNLKVCDNTLRVILVIVKLFLFVCVCVCVFLHCAPPPQ